MISGLIKCQAFIFITISYESLDLSGMLPDDPNLHLGMDHPLKSFLGR